MSSNDREVTLRSARQALSKHVPRQLSGEQLAAVAVVLCEREFEGREASPHLLLIQRASHPDDPWSGHLAFPGGRKDAGDQSSLATAVRETHEEIGLLLTPEHQLLGQLDPITARGAQRPGLVVEPFVFAVEPLQQFVLDPVEVERAFWVPIEPLMRGQADTTVEINRSGQRFKLPGYRIEEHVLWGMTYEMFQALARLSQWLR